MQARTAGHRAGGLAVALAACALLAGCASVAEAPAGVVSTPVAFPSFGHVTAGKPVDLYVKVARLGKACWFAPPAPLQVGYVFTADVAPESKGGMASIVIFEHNAGMIHGANAERGLKAWEATLSPYGEATSITVANARIPEAFAERMQSDIDRWAAGETSCGSTAPWVTKAALEEGPPAMAAGGAHSKLWKAITR